MKKYEIIYVDPPWSYSKYNKAGSGNGVASNHYSTMTIDAIKALPVKSIANKDCCLFLWATMPCLQEALDVIRSWGFTYKTVAFVWVKQNKKIDSLFWGLGSWTRANAELCLLATMGHPKRISASVHQVIVSHVKSHSAKPDEARTRICELLGGVRRRLNFSLERKRLDGMYGVTRSNPILPCRT